MCYCNGGEIVCTSIVCYTRNDCQGYYLPGDCCPKYDNCSSTSKGMYVYMLIMFTKTYLIRYNCFRTKTNRINEF